MRLLDKHSRYLLVTNLLILLLGIFLFYILFVFTRNQHVHDMLLEKKEMVLRELSESDSIYIFQRYSANTLEIRKIPEDTNTGYSFSDSIIYDPLRDKKTFFRQLVFTEKIRGQPYRITVRRSLIDEIEMLKWLLILLPVLAGLLMTALHFANRMVSRKLWQPFYETLYRMRGYGMEEKAEIELPDSNVREFSELNQALRRLMQRIQEDYFALKEYSENTTHEIQTPLAIIQSKLELLQDTSLGMEQLQLVNAATQAVRRLAKLKETLLLLVRIKNHQFENNSQVQLTELLRNRLAHFEELILLKNLKAGLEAAEKVSLEINPLLAEMLIENLISNAIKHNFPGGTIHLSLTTEELCIRNTGEPPRLPPEDFFKRFVKSDPRSRSLGLGLPIVKAICDAGHLPVKYGFEDNLHTIKIGLNYRIPSGSSRTIIQIPDGAA